MKFLTALKIEMQNVLLFSIMIKLGDDNVYN